MDVSYNGLANNLLWSKWTGLTSESDQYKWIGFNTYSDSYLDSWATTKFGNPTNTDLTSINNAEGTYCLNKYVFLFQPLITGVWSFTMTSSNSNMYSCFEFNNIDDTSPIAATNRLILLWQVGATSTGYLTAGRVYYGFGRSSTLSVSSSYKITFKEPGGSVSTNLATVSYKCNIFKYNGYIDNSLTFGQIS